MAHTDIYDWSFIGTKINPVDKPTPGSSVKRLICDKTWFEGPSFLKLSPELWPVLPQNTPPDKIYNCYELKVDPSIEVKSTSCNPTSENKLKFEPTSSFISSFFLCIS